MPVSAAKIALQKGGNDIAAGKEDVGVFIAGKKAAQAGQAGEQGGNKKDDGGE